MTRYRPSRHYLQAGVAALLFCAFSSWWAWRWTPVSVAAGLFLGTAAMFLYFALRPAIEIHESHVAIGRRQIPWSDIRRIDSTGWLSPLLVHLTLVDDSRVLIIYPGDLDSANSLLRHLRRCAREALIDGIPHQQFWGAAANESSEGKALSSPRYRLLRPEDEVEVERLYQRLKTVRHLDPENSPDEK